MLFSFTVLFVCQLVGEAIARALPFPLPGSVIGMLLLFASLMVRGQWLERQQQKAFAASATELSQLEVRQPVSGLPASLEHTAQQLLGYLPLLFVPAGVGVIQYLDRLLAEGPRLLLVLLLSTALALAWVALVLQRFAPASTDGASSAPYQRERR